jgi:hypothetical protein
MASAKETKVKAPEEKNLYQVSQKPFEQTEVAEAKVFSIYIDKADPNNHYIPSGWMGDISDIEVNDGYSLTPHSGTSCIQFVYSAKRSRGQGWAGVYWQNPANNWGNKKGGYDLTGFNKLTFWARGQAGDEVIEKFKVGGIKGLFPDSADVEVGPIRLTTEWKQYSISLSGQDLSYISGAFAWVASARLNPQGATFYLDDIQFEFDPTLKTQANSPVEMPFYVYKDLDSMENHFVASGWMGDTDSITVNEAWDKDTYLGKTCIKITYSPGGSQRWAGVYWQNPANNWGNVRGGGFDLSKATKLTFWARGEQGGEIIDVFKAGGIEGQYPDSDIAQTNQVILTPQWQQYTIDLGGKDLSRISGGFAWATNLNVNPEGLTFYLDEIRYE